MIFGSEERLGCAFGLWFIITYTDLSSIMELDGTHFRDHLIICWHVPNSVQIIVLFSLPAIPKCVLHHLGLTPAFGTYIQ